jgi:hypothetical protein
MDGLFRKRAHEGPPTQEKKMNRSFFAVAAVIGAAALTVSSADARTMHQRTLNGAYGYSVPNGAYARPGPPITTYGAEHYARRAPQSDLNPDFQLGGNR